MQIWSEYIFYWLLVETIPTGWNIPARAICFDIRILTDLRRLLFTILMTCKQTGGKILKIKDTFFTLNLLMTATEIRRVSLLRIFFISLDKSVLLHRRCLMSKFPEILILVCKKIFSVFYPILHETFSNSCGFALI